MADKNLKKAVDAVLKGGASNESMSEARQALAEQLSRLLGEDAGGGPGAAAGGKPKVVRDSFTMPEYDYNLIAELQERALDLRMHVTKGEVLRAGLRALTQMDDADLVGLLRTVEKLKPGRQKDA